MDFQQPHEPGTMEGKFLPMTSIASGLFEEVSPGVYSQTIQIVNIAYIETKNGFVLIDTGMPESSDKIIRQIDDYFGANERPEAIILTHGHFDHVGSVEDLIERWNVPVYAHLKEMPYLTGQKNYPEPDGTVEGGMVAKMSPLFPNEGIDLCYNVEPLPEDGSVPFLSEWRWIHTPGHSDGHISLFREWDRTLIAGDAFITVRQDSLYKVLVQEQEINGPPRYLTTDWKAAKKSVQTLASLAPECVISGHGLPMFGEELQEGLKKLAEEFDSLAIPDYGKYI